VADAEELSPSLVGDGWSCLVFTKQPKFVNSQLSPRDFGQAYSERGNAALLLRTLSHGVREVRVTIQFYIHEVCRTVVNYPATAPQALPSATHLAGEIGDRMFDSATDSGKCPQMLRRAG
jgi:hypothetical protein